MMDPSFGPVERAIRARFNRHPTTLRTFGRGVEFEFDYDDEGVALYLGQGRWRSNLPWEAMESIPAFLQGQGGWVEAGGQHSTVGDPTTLDGHLKQWQKTDVARWLVRALDEAGVVDVNPGRPLRLRAR